MIYAKKIIIGITIFAFVVAIVFLSNEWNRAAFGSIGYIEQGKKFGIIIGSPLTEKIEALKARGFIHELPTKKHSCFGRDYPENIKLDLIYDDSWRRGSICIGSKSGVITSINWRYDMFRP